MELFKSNNRVGLALIAALLAVVAVYANSMRNGFHFDDFHTIVDNPAIRSLRNVPRFFTDATTFSVLPANRTYRPVVSTSLALDYWLSQKLGSAPDRMPWFHASTLLLFLLLIAALFGFYREILNRTKPATVNVWIALFCAAWFGLHPAMAETVNYIIQRGDLYCTLGCVSGLYIFARYPRLRRTGIYLLPFAMALLSKPPAAVFPALVIIYVFFFESAQSSLASRLIPSSLAGIPSSIVTFALLILQSRMTPRTFTPSVLSPWEYRLTQPYVWLRYAGELFLPLHLNVDTDLQVFTGFNMRAVAGGLFVVAVCFAIWMTARHRECYPIAYGLLWFVITQLPTSLYPLSEVENDHRMFFSFPGLILAVVWAGWMMMSRLTTVDLRYRLRPAFATVALLFLSSYAYGVCVRNKVWKDEETLWRDDVIKSPNNGRGLMIYGLTKMNRGEYTEALSDFQRALVFTPNYSTLEINIGVVTGVLADQGDTAQISQAQRHFQRAIALAPQSDEPLAYYGRWLLNQGQFAEAHKELTSAVTLNPQRLMQRELLISTDEAEGDAVEAEQQARETLAIFPDDLVARDALASNGNGSGMNAVKWIELSLSQYRNKQYARSLVSAQNALKLDPQSAEAWNNAGAAQGAMQQWEQAIHDEQNALRINPGLVIARSNLRFYLQQSGASRPTTAEDYLNRSLVLNHENKFMESIAAARQALQLKPDMPEAWNNIAAAYAALRQWDRAIDAARKAIALRPDFQLAKNNLAWAYAQKAVQGP